MNNYSIKKKKALICTYCTWSSYGSILQAYGFNLFLEKNNFNCSFLLNHNQCQYFLPGYITRNRNIFIHFILKLINAFFEKKRKIRYKYNLAFINQHFHTIYFSSYTELTSNKFDFDLFISGSDQVFNPAIVDFSFFLDFVPKEKKKISYAASLGSLCIPKNKEILFKQLINNFDFISLRESDAVNIVSQYYSNTIYTNIDPTLLIESNIWDQISKPYPIKCKYYLVYAIYWDKKLNSRLRQLKKKTGCSIYVLSEGITKIFHDRNIVDADVSQFIWLIKNSEGVITSSFHGACFSLIFHKKFSAIINPDLPSRLSCLLSKFSYPINEIQSLPYSDFDYSKFENIRKQEINKAKEYFRIINSYEK